MIESKIILIIIIANTEHSLCVKQYSSELYTSLNSEKQFCAVGKISVIVLHSFSLFL